MAARHPVSGDTGGTSGGTQGWESLTEMPGLGWGAMCNRGSGGAELHSRPPLHFVVFRRAETGWCVGFRCFLRGILEPCPGWVYSMLSDH